MAVNKIVYNGNTLIDLTEDTVTEADLLPGVTAHNAAGVAIIGTGDDAIFYEHDPTTDGTDVVSGNVDWNTLIKNGCYKVQGATMTAENHAPVSEYAYGVLFCMYTKNSDGNRAAVQMYFPHVSGEGSINSVYRHMIVIRILNTNVWGEWASIGSSLLPDIFLRVARWNANNAADYLANHKFCIYEAGPSVADLPYSSIYHYIMSASGYDTNYGIQLAIPENANEATPIELCIRRKKGGNFLPWMSILDGRCSLYGNISGTINTSKVWHSTIYSYFTTGGMKNVILQLNDLDNNWYGILEITAHASEDTNGNISLVDCSAVWHAFSISDPSLDVDPTTDFMVFGKSISSTSYCIYLYARNPKPNNLVQIKVVNKKNNLDPNEQINNSETWRIYNYPLNTTAVAKPTGTIFYPIMSTISIGTQYMLKLARYGGGIQLVDEQNNDYMALNLGVDELVSGGDGSGMSAKIMNLDITPTPASSTGFDLGDVQLTVGISFRIVSIFGSYAPVIASEFVKTSSIRFKENILDLSETDAKKILKFRPIIYDYKEEYGKKKNQEGLIAEEVEEIDPYHVFYDKEGKPSGIDYSSFVPKLIKMIQIQQKEIEDLKTRIADLEK